ncbi:hypothetical protein [Tomitella biformata]|uniref:hypothetical protein n=1 Tax=Tomitella biformata TaxID=630403 RepID=UPI0004AFB1E8|nr:hypothetical protein [Tomitella biformata]
MSPDPVEIVPGKLYALGDTVPNDGRISWAAPDAYPHEPIAAYLLLETDTALLVDTGVAAHEQTVLGQLSGLIGPEVELSVFCTRFEGDCLTNLGPLIQQFNVVSIFGGGVSNPFDFFDDVSPQEQIRTDHAIEILRKRAGDKLSLGPGRDVELVATSLRVLTTFWLFDEATGALFTSDGLGFEGLHNAGLEGLVRDAPPETLELADLAPRLFTKFDWLLRADTRPFAAELERLFATRDIRIIAPGHGRVMRGPETVEFYYAATQSLLETCVQS